MPGEGKRFQFHGAFKADAAGKKKARAKEKAIPGAFIRRHIIKGKPRLVVMSGKTRNTDEQLAAAAKMSEEFHGRPARKVTEFKTPVKERDAFADLGRLIQMKLYVRPGERAVLDFTGNIRVTCTPDGGQIYFIGGNQTTDLDPFGLKRTLPKDYVVLGEVRQITYHTSKLFHNFAPTDYWHNFGDEGGERPMLEYDTQNRLLYLTGGSYQVRPEGISN